VLKRTITIGGVVTLLVLAGTMSGGGGGDGIASEFLSIGHETLEAYRSGTFSNAQFDISLLLKSLESLKVSSTPDDLIVDGAQKDAKNWPAAGRIKINRERWNNLSWSDRQRLVVHEIVSVNGYDDHDYGISNAIIVAAAIAPTKTYMDIHKGFDSVGNDYHIETVGNEDECAIICNRDAKCVAMEFSNKTNKCYLKQGLGATSASRDGVLGLKTIGFRKNTDYNGGDYLTFSTNDVYSCSQRCVQEAQCLAFTFNTETKLCWLKNTKVQKVADVHAIGGRK
jgi:hypothetical protein